MNCKSGTTMPPTQSRVTNSCPALAHGLEEWLISSKSVAVGRYASLIGFGGSGLSNVCSTRHRTRECPVGKKIPTDIYRATEAIQRKKLK